MKQTITQDGETLYVFCTNLDTTPQTQSTVTGSLSYQSFFAQHRIRIVNGQPITTVFDEGAGYEIAVPLISILHGYDCSQRLVLIDENPLNVCRSNIKTRANTEVNTFAKHGNSVYLKLPNAQVAYVDCEDLDRIRMYQWATQQSHNRYIVTANYYTDKKKKTISLNRYVLGMDPEDRRVIQHLNNDPLDCRKSNLRIIEKRG